MEKNEFSPIRAMITHNLSKFEDSEANVHQVFGLAKTEQDNLAHLMRASLPAGHPWFKIAGVEPPEHSDKGNYLDTYRERHHILSPGLRNWRDDITDNEMEEAKDAVLGYDDSPETARKRRAKAEYRRRNPGCWSFTPEFERMQLAAAHNWRWRDNLLNR